MSYFINKDSFKGALALTIDDGSFFEDFAEDWEAEWFKSLLGEGLYVEFMASPDDAKWDDLKSDCGSLFKYFFFFYYVIEIESSESTLGAMAADVENAERARQSRNYKAVRNFNHGVQMYPDIYAKIKANPDYVAVDDEITINKQNIWAV